MDKNIIEESTALSLSEQITFPEVIMKLFNAGVERYIADLTGMIKLSFGIDGETHIEALSFSGPKIPETLDIVAVATAIKDIQQGRIQYKEFLTHIMKAGCCHYEVYITGKKAIYFGRDGSLHIEYFAQHTSKLDA